MFDVLMYLFETYIHSEAEMRVDQDKLTRDLTDAGFEREDIYNALDTAEFELEDLKWVILMVLFNIPGCENAYQQMEELLFEVNEGMLH
ncbi:DUF494 family protein [Klebsiella quasipneumoniae subsp. quasipneumoniae]